MQTEINEVVGHIETMLTERGQATTWQGNVSQIGCVGGPRPVTVLPMTPLNHCSNLKPATPAAPLNPHTVKNLQGSSRFLPAALAAALFLLLPAAVACTNANSDAAPSPSVIAEPDESKGGPNTHAPSGQAEQTPGTELTFANVLAEVASGAKLFDVREPSEFAEGHFDKAENYSLQLMASGQMPQLNPGTKVFVYCRSGGRSASAAEILSQAGFTNVVDLGGLADVEAIGGQLIRE